jgi:hypothetical protein
MSTKLESIHYSQQYSSKLLLELILTQYNFRFSTLVSNHAIPLLGTRFYSQI